MAHFLYARKGKNNKKVSLSGVGKAGSAVAAGLAFLSRLSIRNWLTRIVTIGVLTFAALATVWFLLPKAEYLPQGNRNFIINFMIPPPGYSYEKRKAIGDYIFTATKPYFEQDGKDGLPQIRGIFFVAADRLTLFGGMSRHETRARELIPLFMRVMNSIPGVMGFSLQAGIFQEGLGRGRNVDVNISGDDIDRIIGATWMLRGVISQKLPGSNVRPDPSPENSYPEANFIPDRSKVLANGLSEYQLGLSIDVIMDGRKIGEFKPEQSKKIDLVLRSDQADIRVPEDVANSVIANSFGQLIRIGDVARIQYDQGLTQIYHLERKRSIKLIVTPSLDVPLQSALEIIQKEVLTPAAPGGSVGWPAGHRGRKCRQAAGSHGRYRLEPRPGGVDHLPAHGGFVRELSLSVDHHVQRAVGRCRWIYRPAPGGSAGGPAAVRYRYHAGIYHSYRDGGEQCDPDCSPGLEQRASLWF